MADGNGDLHAKNVSMVQQPAGEWSIAPVYDIPSTVVYGDKTLALTLDGKRTGISRKHFLGWAAGMGLTERAAVQVLELALRASEPLLADLQAGTAFRLHDRRRRLAVFGDGHPRLGQGTQTPAQAAGGVMPPASAAGG